MSFWRALRWSLAQRGLGGTLRAGAGALRRRLRPAKDLARHPFDEQFGVETSGLIFGRDLARGEAIAAEITGYAGVSVSRFELVLEQWRRLAGDARVPEFAFVDIGCGKGRALMLASRWAFREAWGVEVDRILAGIAQKNLAIWEACGEGRCPVRVVQGDALSAELPAAAVVVFLYNPFSPAVMARLLDRLAERQRHGGGELWLIYSKENDDNPLRTDARLACLWREVPNIELEEKPFDPVAAEDDFWAIYRWR